MTSTTAQTYELYITLSTSCSISISNYTLSKLLHEMGTHPYLLCDMPPVRL